MATHGTTRFSHTHAERAAARRGASRCVAVRVRVHVHRQRVDAEKCEARHEQASVGPMGTIPAHAIEPACAVLGGSVMLLARRGDLFVRGAVKYVLGYSRTFR
jgi:hypothetical protein